MEAMEPQTEKPAKLDGCGASITGEKNTQFSKKLRLNYSKVKEIRVKSYPTDIENQNFSMINVSRTIFTKMLKMHIHIFVEVCCFTDIKPFNA